MILYHHGGFHHFTNILKLRGSVLFSAFQVALPCSVLSGVLAALSQNGQLDWLDGLQDNAPWTGFAFLVGFLTVFRTSQCYSRFWEACGYCAEMRRQWHDAASAIVAFSTGSACSEEELWRFRHLIVRLFSMFHAAALLELRGNHTGDSSCLGLKLIDPDGIDAASLRTLKMVDCKVALILQWIQVVVVDSIKTGVLNIAPPILTRVFQMLGDGMIPFEHAQRISGVPFPFPYLQICDLLLFVHWAMTPIIVQAWSSSPGWAAIFGFVMVFFYWALNWIADELEVPFGGDDNDLDFEELQLDMNAHLLVLLAPTSVRPPLLSWEVRGAAEDPARAPSNPECSVKERRTPASFQEVWEIEARRSEMDGCASVPTATSSQGSLGRSKPERFAFLRGRPAAAPPLRSSELGCRAKRSAREARLQEALDSQASSSSLATRSWRPPEAPGGSSRGAFPELASCRHGDI
mmetsp:Transcript_107693/g.347612  ORF Transcript_107693/g.347612 Transcript_107693/m.347612 type:complete len:463 (-) Transcript_107693:106-1494(-)